MRKFTGILLILVSAASFGTLGILGRYAYAAGMDTFTILFLRFGLAAVVMGLWTAWRHEKRPGPGVVLQLVGMGAIGYVGQATLYFSALKYTSPGLVALLLYLYPVFVALLAVVFRHERLTMLKLLALGLALAGVALTVNPGWGGVNITGQWTGILMAVGAALVYSFYIIVGAGVLKQVSAVLSTTIIFASAAAMSGMIVGLQAASTPHWPGDGAAWLVIGWIVVLATLIPVVTFLAGLERIGPTNASMLSTIEPVVTVLLAAWLLSEPLPAIALLGGVLILGAVLLLSWSELRKRS
jgi:drug/metabolite transporter (DMT)-like permease